MKLKKVLLTLLLISAVLGFCVAADVSAADISTEITTQLGNFEQGATGQNSTGKGIVQVAGTLINVIFGILGILLTAYLVYGGFLWMTAAGNQEEVKKAKTIITNSIIAIVIVLAAFAIARFVIQGVLQATL